MTRKSYEQLEAELNYIIWQRDRAIDTAISVVNFFKAQGWNATITHEMIQAAKTRAVDMLSAAGMGVPR